MPRSVVMVGAADSPLAKLVRGAYIPCALTLVLDPRVPDDAALIRQLGYPLAPEPAVYLCQANKCLAPARTAEEFNRRIEASKN